MGKGSKWRKGHDPNKISENMDRVKKTVKINEGKKTKKKGKTTYSYG